MERAGLKVGAALAALFLAIGIVGAAVALQGGGNSSPLPGGPGSADPRSTPSAPATP